MVFAFILLATTGGLFLEERLVTAQSTNSTLLLQVYTLMPHVYLIMADNTIPFGDMG